MASISIDNGSKSAAVTYVEIANTKNGPEHVESGRYPCEEGSVSALYCRMLDLWNRREYLRS